MDFADDVVCRGGKGETGERVELQPGVGGRGGRIVLGTGGVEVIVNILGGLEGRLGVQEIEPRVRQTDDAAGDAVPFHERPFLVKGRVRAVDGSAA